jgi:hypothetical protein
VRSLRSSGHGNQHQKDRAEENLKVSHALILEGRGAENMTVQSIYSERMLQRAIMNIS